MSDALSNPQLLRSLSKLARGLPALLISAETARASHAWRCDFQPVST